MYNCIFCKIVNKELSSYKVYEDDLVLAFLDINPLTFGHTLVIPKEHSEDLLNMDDKFNERILRVCKKISNALKKINSSICSGINIYSSLGADAGQEVFHTHFHVIPRFKNDGFGFKRGNKLNLEVEKFKELSMKISMNL
ncbi:HIT family protein [Borreliella valaisiana]|uniref:Protein kinase C1 inhibitor n=1 Tax=Borreliella valaisiana VS116 TaxID=445987 RepID=D6RXL8_BORVA|nr:HIT family protein [Borreliella valaisiana]EEF82176.1 protein kinase C1 inhibitor [Borreliella valaisiana VS116]